MAAKVTGLDKVVRNLNKEIRRIKGRTVGGLMKAGLKVQRRSQQFVPVEYGKLKQSAYTRKSPENANEVETGYSAAYAPFVHENTEQVLKGKPRPSGLGVYWGPPPDAGPKFLERAFQELRKDILRTIADEARK